MVLLISGCTNMTYDHSQETLDEVNQDMQVSLETSYRMCREKAKTCSEGIPAIEMEFRNVCWELYYYTGNATEVLDFANTMC